MTILPLEPELPPPPAGGDDVTDPRLAPFCAQLRADGSPLALALVARLQEIDAARRQLAQASRQLEQLEGLTPGAARARTVALEAIGQLLRCEIDWYAGKRALAAPERGREQAAC